jgi:hypothetical protein
MLVTFRETFPPPTHSFNRGRGGAAPARKDGQISRDGMTDQHPTAEQLQAFATGQVDGSGAAAIEGHLAVCDSCWAVVEEADDRTAVARVLRSLPAERLRSLVVQAPPGASEEPGPEAPEPPAELLGHPRYRLLGFLGAGGMGQVWKALHELMNRVVAVKTIRPDLLRDGGAVARFRHEVEAAVRLDHPAIVRAYDAERVGDLHFLVMECVEGVDLARLVQERGPLPAAEACGYARQVAGGLAYAHGLGMVHRDIKPHNLLRTPEGRVKVSDFGLASFLAVRDEPAIERPSQIVLSTIAAGSVMRLAASSHEREGLTTVNKKAPGILPLTAGSGLVISNLMLNSMPDSPALSWPNAMSVQLLCLVRDAPSHSRPAGPAPLPSPLVMSENPRRKQRPPASVLPPWTPLPASRRITSMQASTLPVLGIDYPARIKSPPREVGRRTNRRRHGRDASA